MYNKDKLSLTQQISGATVRAEQSEAEFKTRRQELEEKAAILAALAKTETPVHREPPAKTKGKEQRNIQVSVRFSASEHEYLQKKIQASGQAQGEFIRQMVLNGQVLSRKLPDYDDFLIDEIAALRGMCGRLGGLMKMIRRAYEEGNTHHEKTDQWMRDTALTLQDFKLCLQTLEVMLNGDN